MTTTDDTGVTETPVSEAPVGTPGLVVPILFGLAGAWWASNKASKLGVSNTKRYWMAAGISTGVMLLASILAPILVVAAIAGSMGGVTTRDVFDDPAVGAPLTGGTQLTLTPVATGNEQITSETVAEAIRIIRKRLDSSGLSMAVIKSQGGSNIVVVLPGKPDHATLDLVRKPGEMRFRPVLVEGGAAPVASPAPTVMATPMAQAGTPNDASDLAWITPDVEAAYTSLDCANPKYVESIVDNPAKPMVTCSVDGQAKYILGPAEVLGSEISNATSGQQQSQSGSAGIWGVRLEFNAAGAKAFCNVTSRLLALPAPRSQFGIVLDNKVISAPVTQAALCAGNATITGSFTPASAKVLADQIKFGALPLTFLVQSEE